MKIFLTVISLLTFLFTASVDSTRNEYQPKNMDLRKKWDTEFIGLWVNENSERPGITKCKISFENNRYIVQMWGSCTPQDCDWGKNKTDGVEKGANKFELLWDSGFAESTVTYELVEDKLKLTNKRHFKDDSGRPDYTTTEYFVKE
ncbi:hypothetical protein GTQ34_16460 [Muricauda sp. JGD-17]|uniref:Lipocalin-like domain-containing protein n=1 Tax=Flagellimonas ochracea TaxID=2696472 RepID=A0A964TFI7_9FLAO|nr:hypothetical protein [Allomuricauda ochracea]NAY93501.1 hypothetical protein [Allomuricauda ochracea]